jgi:hypothetical protein
MQSSFPQPDVDPFHDMVIGAALLAPSFCEDLSTWRMTVSRDGTVAQELRPSLHSEIYDHVCIHLRSFVSRDIISKITDIANEIDFLTFDAEYHADCTDLEHTSLTLNLNGVIKRVFSYGPQLLARDGNVAMIGYMRLWDIMLEASPYQRTEAVAAPEDQVLNRIVAILGPHLTLNGQRRG